MASTFRSYQDRLTQKTTIIKFSPLAKLLEQVEAFSSLATIVASS
jgi:hypothetical protein